MQKPTIFRAKRLVLELLFDFDSGIVRHFWDIFDDFKVSSLQVQMGGMGLIAEDTERSMIFRLEAKKAIIDFENIDRIEFVHNSINKFTASILKYRKQETFARIGIRTYTMALSEPKLEKKGYVDAVSSLLPYKSLKAPETTDAGFIVRFPKDGWNIRLGVFAYDEQVMLRHHRINTNLLYNQPCLMYDMDFSKGNIKPDDKFDMGFLLRDVHNIGIDVMKTHLDEVWAKK